MRLVEKRMQKEVEERGEKSLEDSKEGSYKEVLGEVSVFLIVDGVREDFKGNFSFDNTFSVVFGIEMRRLSILLLVELLKFVFEEFASFGFRILKSQD